MEQTTAWVLEIGNNLNVAIGKNEMVHLVDNPELLSDSFAGKYCSYSLQWQGDSIPVADIAASLNHYSSADDDDEAPGLVAIVAYQDSGSSLPKYGGLVLKNIPERHLVTNSQACALPEPHDDWLNVAISCFSDNGRTTPILNLAWVFSQ